MSLIEKEGSTVSSGDVPPEASVVRKKVVTADGMAELQSLDKPTIITTCVHHAEHFLEKYSHSDELHHVFDIYDIPLSLKSATRVRRQGDQHPVYYRITDSTYTAKVTVRRLLSREKTKMDLTEYLSTKFVQRSERRATSVLVAWGNNCQATHRDVTYLRSSQEETDTKMILHAVDAASNGATQVNFYSPDTDVIILSLRRYAQLCDDVQFITNTGQRHWVIILKPIVQALGSIKVAALPGLHALSGADITGSFAGKGKATWWKVFKEADEETITALTNLRKRAQPTADILSDVEKLVCQVYVPNTTINNVKELTWWLLRKKQAQSETLQPTQEALRQTMKRSNYQAFVWNLDTVPEPQLPSPDTLGWTLRDDKWVHIMTSLPPAPEATIQLVKCGYVKSRFSSSRLGRECVT